MNSGQGSATSPNVNPGSILIEHIRSFLHLTTQAPLEYVCKSALYLLTHVPATRPAVFEYIGTFYKVATFLHIRYNLSLKNSGKQAEQQAAALLNNITHINQVLDLIEGPLGDILQSDADSINDLWSYELAKWLVELMGDIILNKGVTFTDTPGLSEEETNSFKNLSLVDALEFWSNKCKPTTGILNLIQKCFTTASESCQILIVELIFGGSAKYGECFDWILSDLAAMSPDIMFDKCIRIGYGEYLSNPNAKISRTNFINFYSQNYARVVKNQLSKFIGDMSAEPAQKQRSALVFLLKLISSTSCLSNLVLNEVLTNNSRHGDQFMAFFKSCLLSNNTDTEQNLIIANTIECVNQLNNSSAVVDLISSVIDFVFSCTNDTASDIHSKSTKIIKKFLEDMENSIYNDDNINNAEEDEVQQHSQIPFLKFLSSINASSFNHLIEKIFSIVRSDHFKKYQQDREILYKFSVLVAINGSDYVSNAIMSQLMRLPVSFDDASKKSLAYTEWPMILRFRQEITPFNFSCLRSTVRSLVKVFLNGSSSSDTAELNNFIQNATLIYDWDLKNKTYMSENVSFVMIERECFVSMLGLLGNQKVLNSQATYSILSLYARILSSSEENLPALSLTVADMVVFADKIVSHFFLIFETMNEENLANYVKELNKLNELVDLSLMHLTYLNEDKCPLRNALLRNLISKLFEFTKRKKHENKSNDSAGFVDTEDDLTDMASNLFYSNLNLTSTDIASHKGKFKNFKNTLAEFANNRNKGAKKSHNNKYTILMSFAFMRLLESICSKSLETSEQYGKFKNKRQMTEASVKSESEAVIEDRRSLLLVEQMSHLADMIVQNLMLDQHYIDEQWPSAMTNESEDNIEAELEAMKLYIERDMAIQNIVENTENNKLIWMILEFLAQDEQSFIKARIIVRSVLASIIVQWDSYHEQQARNLPKLLEITLRILNVLNKVPNLMSKPLCYIVDIIPLINAYEALSCLFLIWKDLKAKLQMQPKQLSLNQSKSPVGTPVDTRPLRYIFQKNILKLDFLYSKFFKVC